ncbi:YDG domain-containing protein [Acinetobacter silvestris]|uniref:Filamentous haemagglutinin FhaB/tRNA nuclease CdiA-like TPS domain-containing protein n=1 Tax=Acinetobacter silvestris TaxID=1977882 RepID=A0A1Y3CN99_9GAMM|nr:YDG domain-containing protein [Acinetobacter silvestris]OTG66601.1 hypothetical protein B9T28_04960 [Acinetobacter silvestris]
MNKIYKVIWNTQLSCWQAVSELAKNHSGGSSQNKILVDQQTSLISKVVGVVLFSSVALLPLSIHAAIQDHTLPTGAQINSGSAQFSQNGNTLNINQNSQNLSTNWNAFNIGKDAIVNFNQPNQSSTAINHVMDSNASQIMGRLNANGQVFLLNPNGVVFSKTAQVNVGGLVASTLKLNDADIQKGKYTLKGDANSTATIENHGTINTLQGGTVALIAPNVKNTGTITTPNGTTHLTSASQVTLALQNGSLTQYQVDLGVLQGLVDNGGAIIAENGAVYLTAKAKGSLSKAVINHSGIIEANRSTQNAKGEIILLGDMQNGETNVSGTLKAEGKNGQNGGFIETSAAKVNIDKDIKISTLSEGGKTGNWLIDPHNVVISNATDTGTGFVANQDDTVINATTLINALATTGVTVYTGGTAVGTQDGNITVDADLAWSSNSTLTLQADKDIILNKKITATSGGLTLNAANNISAKDAINVGTFTLNKGNWLQNAPVLPSFYAKDFRLNGGSFIRAIGGDGSSATPWKLTDIYGVQGMGTQLNGNFALANHIDASGTVNWNGGAGFNPIGDGGYSSPTTSFSGTLDGLNYIISKIFIYKPNSDYIGLIGSGTSAQILNVGITEADITGASFTGVLAGYLNGNSKIQNSYTTGSVKSGSSYIGGVVGALEFSNGNTSALITLTNTFSNAKIDGGNTANYVGGLVGVLNSNTVIDNTYFSGRISNVSNYIGGIAGAVYNSNNFSIKINNSYVTGGVNGTSGVGSIIGGGGGVEISNSFWNNETVGQTQAVGNNSGTLSNVIGLTTTQMFDKNNFSGFDFGSVWGNGNNQTTPYLLGLANNQVFNKNDLPTGIIDSTNRPALYTAILNVNQLQNMNKNLSGKYLLGNNIDASDTVNWNSGAGFNPIGTGIYNVENDTSKAFIGLFDGLGQSINNIFINNSTNDYVGLFGYTGLNSQIKNVGVEGGRITGGKYVGGLVGLNSGSINSAYATGTVSATSSGGTAGGLVGKNMGSNAKIENTYATNKVLSTQFAGGLVGYNNYGSISNGYATGEVSAQFAGGLVGNNNGTINNVYATGVVDVSVAAGGVVALGTGGAVSNAYWNKETTGASEGVYSGSDNTVGLTTAEMRDGTNFTFIDANSYLGGKNTVWRIYDGQTAPLLRNFLTTLDLNTINKTTTYNGKNQTLATVNGLNNNLLVSSGNAGGRNAGDYSANYYSNQQGYDLIANTATLKINKAVINAITGITANNKTYDGKNTATLNTDGAIFNGIIVGDDLALTGATGTFSDKNAGTGKTVTINGISLSGADAGNYNLVNNTASSTADISKANLNIGGITANNKTYDGKNTATLNTDGAIFNGIIVGDDLALTGATGTFSDKNAGTGKTVTISGISLSGADAGNYNLVNNTASSTADISKANLNIGGITANNKTYDGKNTATLNTDGATFNGIIAGDDLTLTGATGTFSDKNAGTGKTVTINGISLSGADTGNYLVNSTASSTADISKANLNIGGITANNKTYDGKNTATLNTDGATFNGIIAGDDLTLTGATGTFSDKNVGTGKQVNLAGITLSGTDAGNYQLDQVQTSTQATITQAKATVTANSNNTIYNGQNQTVSGFTASGLVNGEDESVLTGINASITAKNAGNYLNKASGVDTNYDLTFVDGSLNIAKAKINQVTGITANDRVYDASTNVVLNTGSAQFDGIIHGDQLGVATATGQFTDKNVGTDKRVDISNISLSGTDSHNYELVVNTAQTTADITKANIYSITGITADNRIYNGHPNVTLNTSNAQFNGIFAGDDLQVKSSMGQFESSATGQNKNVKITGLSLSGTDAGNYYLVDTTAQTTAAISMVTPEAYLQAIQLRRPQYLPTTNVNMDNINLEVRNGGVNTTGIRTLTGEH